MEAGAGLVAGSHNRNELVVIRGDGLSAENVKPLNHADSQVCQICGDDVGRTVDGELFVACNECASQDISPEHHALVVPPMYNAGSKRIHPLPYPDSHLPVQVRTMDPSKDPSAYGYGSVAWKERVESWKLRQEKMQMTMTEGQQHPGKGGDGDDDNGPELPMMDEARQPLSRKIPIPPSKINPYRMVIIVRLVVLGFFLRYRILNPVKNAFALWLTSVICEIWFAFSWILDQFPKWFPINRETYLDRLSLRYNHYQ